MILLPSPPSAATASALRVLARSEPRHGSGARLGPSQARMFSAGGGGGRKSPGSLANELAAFAGGGSNSRSVQTTGEQQGAASTVSQKLLGVSAVGYTVVKFGGSLKIVLPILKLAKAGPLISMGLTSVAYSAIFGPMYGCGMVGLLFASQLGSGLARHQFGLPVGASTFIPFMGSMSTTSEEDARRELFEVSYDRDGNEIPPSAYRDALIAISGPGLLLGITYTGPVACGVALGSQMGLALADFGFMLTLISLAPVGSLPGGTVLGACSKWFLPAGLAGLTAYLGLSLSGALGLTSTSPILFLVWALGAYRTYRVFRPDALEQWRRHAGYYDTTRPQQMFLGAGYVILLATALFGQQVLVAPRKKDPRALREEQRLQQVQELAEKRANGTLGAHEFSEPPQSDLSSASYWNPGEWALSSLDELDSSELLQPEERS